MNWGDDEYPRRGSATILLWIIVALLLLAVMAGCADPLGPSSNCTSGPLTGRDREGITYERAGTWEFCIEQPPRMLP